MTKKILILPGDGIGVEIVAQAEKTLRYFIDERGLDLELIYGLIGGSAVDVEGVPLTNETLAMAKESAAVLLGAVGGKKWDLQERSLRPEQGLLTLRSELGLFANLRPAVSFQELVTASSLREEIISGLDIMIIRELTSGIYFGEPRGITIDKNGQRKGFNTLVYTESEIEQIAHVAFSIASQRHAKICSVDKANVLESSELWREVVERVAKDYPKVSLQHMYVDNAAMQLVREPKQFDVLLTSNMFGDILSDIAAMLTGSIGMLPSASLTRDGFGMYEPIHGSAPQIAGQDLANPLGTILSVAMLLRYSLSEYEFANHIEQAVAQVLADGLRTRDIYVDGMTCVGTTAMGEAVLKHCQGLDV